MSDLTSPTDEDLQMITREVWASYLDSENASPLVPGLVNASDTQVTAAVSITGAWQGHVVVSCSDAASRNAAAALLGVELGDVTNEDVTDALGELANIIGGNVKGLVPEPSSLSLPYVQLSGKIGCPFTVETCHLAGTWRDEPIMIRVFESATSTNGARTP
jgi:chemotaxis protein CheX